MEKDRSSKVIAIVGLVVAVAALSIGFAAFTQNLTIKPSATVTPSDTRLNVLFSSSNTAQKTDAVKANPATSVDNKQYGEDATINNNDGTNPTISGLHAIFTDKGQTVTYTFYVHNASEYIAYLRGITFNNATGAEAFKKCSVAEGNDTNAAMVAAACADISLKVEVAGGSYTDTNTAISGKSIAIDGYETVVVTIDYDGDKNSTIPIPDGDFEVAFGDIVLNYSSIDKTN